MGARLRRASAFKLKLLCFVQFNGDSCFPHVLFWSSDSSGPPQEDTKTHTHTQLHTLPSVLSLLSYRAAHMQRGLADQGAGRGLLRWRPHAALALTHTRTHTKIIPALFLSWRFLSLRGLAGSHHVIIKHRCGNKRTKWVWKMWCGAAANVGWRAGGKFLPGFTKRRKLSNQLNHVSGREVPWATALKATTKPQ